MALYCLTNVVGRVSEVPEREKWEVIHLSASHPHACVKMSLKAFLMDLSECLFNPVYLSSTPVCPGYWSGQTFEMLGREWRFVAEL